MKILENGFEHLSCLTLAAICNGDKTRGLVTVDPHHLTIPHHKGGKCDTTWLYYCDLIDWLECSHQLVPVNTLLKF